tara:strand:+ start:791 stop:988 length:198 start_codon:yes stop_codon:yes gene_type:complete
MASNQSTTKNKMNRIDIIDHLRNQGIESSKILDEMIMWLPDTEVRDFFQDYVRLHDITFGDEDDK